MSKVYLIEDVNHATYYGTKKEAKDAQYRAEEPERIQTLDAAHECNAQLWRIKELDDLVIELTCALRGMVAVAPMEILKETQDGREAVRLMAKLDPDFIESCGLSEKTD